MNSTRAERRRRRWSIILAILDDEEARQEQRPRSRLDWNFEVEQLLHEGEFKRAHHMSVASFDRLCCLLVQPNHHVHSWINRSPISIANKLQMTLRYLSGGMIDDVRRGGGVDRSYCYRVVKDVMRAIVAIPSLKIRFPTSPTEREQAAAGFAARSNERIMNGCVAALDGWLCNIQTPSDTEAGSAAGARRYFSGHYMHSGINVQAACDAFSRFVLLEATHPGGVNDSRAYDDSGIPAVIEGLERGLYVVADAAYTASNHLLTPYTALQPDEIYKDSFNFHLSQVRIRIEMAFGLLTKRWGIFHRPLQLHLENTTLIIKCAAVLHNFVVTERLERCRDPVYQELRQIAREERRTVQSLLTYEDDRSILQQTNSFVREGIVAKLRSIPLLRAN